MGSSSSTRIDNENEKTFCPELVLDKKTVSGGDVVTGNIFTKVWADLAHNFTLKIKFLGIE